MQKQKTIPSACLYLETPQLILRSWKESDFEPFSRINADSRVMKFFPKILNRVESDQMVEKIRNHFNQHGFGFYAIEIKTTHQFIGFVGLAVPRFEAAFMPCVEIGWRLDAEFWNQGFATEAATGVLAYAFKELNLKEVVSFTSELNLASRRVMEKLGMTHNPADDFDHPSLLSEDRLRHHVLYRIQR